jgi:hypothetical protein
MKRALPVALALLAAAAAALDAQKPQAPPSARPGVGAPAGTATPRGAGISERPVPFKPGEKLTYDVSWSNFLTAGTATVNVVEKKPSYGSVAYYITAEGRPTALLSRLYSLYYKMDTLIDVYTLLPQRGSVYSEENGRRRMKITRFNQAARTADYEVQTTTVTRRGMSVPAFTQDALSALFILRALGLKQGDKMTIPVVDGGATYRAAIVIGPPETVTTGIGSVTALRVTLTITDQQGRPVGRNLALWVSAGERRLPVKLRADLPVGSFNLVLKSAAGTS